MGTGQYFDALIVALSIPGFFRRVLGEAMFETVIAPCFNRMRASKQDQKAFSYLKSIMIYLSLFVTFLTVFLYFISPWLLRLLAPGFDMQTLQIAIKLQKILMFYISLIAAATFIGAIMYSFGSKVEKKYEIISSVAPAMWNVGIILFITIFVTTQVLLCG